MSVNREKVNVEKGKKGFQETEKTEAVNEANLGDVAATVTSGEGFYDESQIEAIAAKFPNIESISFRVDEDWDTTIEGDDGEEWPVLKAIVIDVIERDGEEIDGSEYEDAEDIGAMIDSELTQAVLRDVYDNDLSIPVFLNPRRASELAVTSSTPAEFRTR